MVSATRGTLTEPGQESPWRNRSVEENLDLLERMKQGEFPDGARVLRAKIDMNQTKPLRVAGGPLEIVQQRPHKVALDRHPPGDGLLQRLQVHFEIRDPARIVDLCAIGFQDVRHRATIFRDVDFFWMVRALDVYQQFTQAIGVNFPVHLRILG